jgi:hypothetical protein
MICLNKCVCIWHTLHFRLRLLAKMSKSAGHKSGLTLKYKTSRQNLTSRNTLAYLTTVSVRDLKNYNTDSTGS